MNELEKTILFNKLLVLYKPLLSKTQQEILDEYYCVNLSISEIAEERGVSRAAVEDAIKKGSNKLLEYEKTLQFLKKQENNGVLLRKLKEKCSDEEIIKIIEELERSI